MTRTQRRNLAIAWTLLIVAACTIPGTDLPRIEIRMVDKLAHVTLFAVFAWLWLAAGELPLPPLGRFAAVILIGIAFGILTEIYQGLLPWERQPDALDAIANAVGLAAGSAAFGLHRSVRNRKRGNY